MNCCGMTEWEIDFFKEHNDGLSPCEIFESCEDCPFQFVEEDEDD